MDQDISTTPGRRPARRWWPLLLAVGALAVVAALVIGLAIGRGSVAEADAPATAVPVTAPTASPSPPPTPSAVPTSTPEADAPAAPAPPPPAAPAPAPQPPAPQTQFTQFFPGTSAGHANCMSDQGWMTLTFQWASINATNAWIGIDTKNAKQHPFAQVPTSGSFDVTYYCDQPSQTYTVTIEGPYGIAHKTVTLTRN